MAEDVNALYEEANELVDSFEGVFDTEEIDAQKKENFFAVLLIEASNLRHRIHHQLSLNEAQDSLILRSLAQKIDEIVESLDPYLYHKPIDEPHQYNKDDESLSQSEREEAIRFGLYENPSFLTVSDELRDESANINAEDVFDPRFDEEEYIKSSASIESNYEYEDIEDQLTHMRGSKNTMLI